MIFPKTFPHPKQTRALSAVVDFVVMLNSNRSELE
jgi:hypothetical protein